MKGFETTKRKLNEWIDRKGMLSTGHFWNEVHPEEVLMVAPELKWDLKKAGFVITYASIIQATYAAGSVHIDQEGLDYAVQARLNIPLRNIEGSTTRFYKADREKLALITAPNGVKYSNVSMESCVEVERIVLNEPTVLRISEPHAVYGANSVNPRLALTLRLYPDPVCLLQ